MAHSNVRFLLDQLAEQHGLTWTAWRTLLADADADDRQQAAQLARQVARSTFGNAIYYRGIVEFTNYCRNNCRYCGIRRGHTQLPRYRLFLQQILDCCAVGYGLGVRTFVLQGGEDPWFTDARLVLVVEALRRHFPEAVITLSLGERSRESYQRLFAAGARRYLLRHETADPRHYRQLHPAEQNFWQRMACLHTLRDMGYQTGCGMMVGSPGQSVETLAEDMSFMQTFRPHMIGLGPFLPHHATPFRHQPPGDAALTLFLLSLCRLMLPQVLLPATTALRTLLPDGLAQGVMAGCNVVMPNLTACAAGYRLYDGKPAPGDVREHLHTLQEEVAAIGYELVSGRGDADMPTTQNR